MNMEGKLGTQRVVPSAMLFKMAAILNQLSLGWTMIIFIYLTYNVSSQKTYRVTTIVSKPFVFRSGSGFSGYVPDVLAEAGKILNASFIINHVSDGQYGALSNSNWSGMIGELVRNESDIAAADLTISFKRAEIVHFSQPYFDLGLRILIKKPAKWQEMEAFMVILSPLKPEVWIIGLVLFFAVSILLTIIGKFSPWEQLSVHGGMFDITSPGLTFPNSLLFSFGTLMWQGFRGTPRSVSGRTLACFWWIFAMFFLTVYGANLTAFFLTKEPLRQSVPFSTFHEMTQQTKVKFGCFKNGAAIHFFKVSPSTVDNRVYQAIMADPTVLVQSTAEGIQRVKDGGYAYIGESLTLEYTAAQDCELMVVGELRSDREYGFACRKDTTLCRDLDVVILMLKESWTLARLRKKWFSGPCMSNAQREAMWNGELYGDTASQIPGILMDEKAVTLRRLGPSLILLLIGALLSLAVLAAEILWAKRYGDPQVPTLSEDERRIRDNMDMAP